MKTKNKKESVINILAFFNKLRAQFSVLLLDSTTPTRCKAMGQYIYFFCFCECQTKKVDEEGLKRVFFSFLFYFYERKEKAI